MKKENFCYNGWERESATTGITSRKQKDGRMNILEKKWE